MLMVQLSGVPVTPEADVTLKPSAGFGETMCDFSIAPLADGCLLRITPDMWKSGKMRCAPTGCLSDDQIEREFHSERVAYALSEFGQQFPFKACSNSAASQVAMVWGRLYDPLVGPPVRTDSTIYQVICPHSSTGTQPAVEDDRRSNTKIVRAQSGEGMLPCREPAKYGDCNISNFQG